MKKDTFGVFEVVVPAVNGEPAIKHNSKVKVDTFCSRSFPS
jgi:1,4-alpha-glucan branching enzyme